MNDAEHRVERYVRDTFKLDEVGLRRVAVFLLAHVLVDTRLIARAMFKEINDRNAEQEPPRQGLPLTTLEEIADKAADGAFGTHLGNVSAGLPSDMTEIAERINKARVALLHWKRDRFSLPVYKGQDLTTDEGFRSCMDDVLRFIQVVPFNVPTGGGVSP